MLEFRNNMLKLSQEYLDIVKVVAESWRDRHWHPLLKDTQIGESEDA